MSNSDTAQFELSQFGAWFIRSSCHEFLERAEDTCQLDTLEIELARLEEWEQQNGKFYDPKDFEKLWTAIAETREWMEERDNLWYDEEASEHAEEARAAFTVIEGGKK